MRISGPLYGDKASGVFGGLFAFSEKRGLAVVSKPPAPRRVVSPLVIAHQSFYSQACAAWSSLSGAEKEEYSLEAPVHLTGFQYYLSLFASSTPFFGVSAFGVDGWDDPFDYSGLIFHVDGLYLMPDYSSGFFIFQPVDLSSVRSFLSYEIDFESSYFPDDTCFLMFAASGSGVLVPDIENFSLATLENLEAAFPLGSSGAGLFLWVLIIADIS